MDSPDYSTFAEQCVQDLKCIQQKFMDEHDINWYANWFYDQATCLLTFSTGDVELNFRYFHIGSYSEKSSTWKWSWDNQHTLDKAKEKSFLVKAFGERSHFPRLTEGLFESEEAEGWEFAAIAVRITDAIGVYRPVSDQLKIFLIVTELVDNDTARKIKEKYLHCDTHDTQRNAFVCQHLIHADGAGFEEAFETVEGMELGEDDDFQAWCDECEAVRQKEGEWNDRSQAFAGITVVCEKCYFEIKARNQKNLVRPLQEIKISTKPWWKFLTRWF